MDKQFWIDAWTEGRTGFHQQEINPQLKHYYPQLQAKKDGRVFVPLCGKTLDMLWLLQQGLKVEAVELYQQAISEFFTENHLPTPKILEEGSFRHFRLENLKISCGDFFALSEENPFDLIYDRASLVALPQDLRLKYAQKLTRMLKVGGRYLLLTYQYDESQMSGPPFSLSFEEVQHLYSDHFTIIQLENEKALGAGKRLESVPSLKQQVYLLTKDPR